MLSLNSYTVEKIKSAEVMVIGCSAGGFSLIFDILLSLPAEFPLAVVVIIHRSRKYKSSMEAVDASDGGGFAMSVSAKRNIPRIEKENRTTKTMTQK